VAVIGAADDPQRAELHRVALASPSPGAAVVVGEPSAPGSGGDSDGSGPETSPVVPLLRDRPLVDGAAAAYVCRGFVCDRPVTDPEALRAALRR
ncbi:MAG: N-acylglucosamine 2-epimerase, partial [Actinomycetota bacterium]|nr:N-acylglucosamine 2-epimerase [Actinomycetota bacterium]